MGADGYNTLWRKDWRSTSPIRYRTTKITAAQVLLLNSVPKELVPTPGLGKAIEFVSAVLHLDFNSTEYASYGTLVVRTDTDTVLSGTLATAFLFASADAIAVMEPLSTGIKLGINEALELDCSDDVPTAGNSPITVIVAYRVHSFVSY